MKIYLVENINPFNKIIGGIGIYLKNLIHYLKKRNENIYFIGVGNKNNHNSNQIGIKKDLFIPVKYVRQGKISHPEYVFRLLIKYHKLKISPKSIIHAQRPDVLFPFALFKKNMLVCSLHGRQDELIYFKRGKVYGRVYEFLERYSFKKVDVLVAVDNLTYDYYLAKFPFIKQKMVIIPIGVDFMKFKPLDKQVLRAKYGYKNDDKIIINVGRLSKEKNIIFLLNVMKRLNIVYKNVKLILVGSGKEENTLKKYILDNNIDNVIFMGSMNSKKIIELLNISDIFAFCSKMEGSPTTIKEALACNIPVVSFDVGDVASIIEKFDGCHIVNGEPEEFCNAIQTVFRDKLNIYYREKIKKYNNDILFNKLYSIYKILLKNTDIKSLYPK